MRGPYCVRCIVCYSGTTLGRRGADMDTKTYSVELTAAQMVALIGLAKGGIDNIARLADCKGKHEALAMLSSLATAAEQAYTAHVQV